MRSNDEFAHWMIARGGVAHTGTLRRAGFTTHGIRAAVAAGSATWVRRSWLAIPGADADLRRAATLGARVTCLSGAKRLGLWRGTARKLASVASDLSDSGLETRFVALVCLLGVTVRQQVWIDGHPVDGLIGDRLVVQVDGFAHHQAVDRRRDLRADARLVLLGYTVLRFDYVQILFHPGEVLGAIAMALAQQRHLVGGRR